MRCRGLPRRQDPAWSKGSSSQSGGVTTNPVLRPSAGSRWLLSGHRIQGWGDGTKAHAACLLGPVLAPQDLLIESVWLPACGTVETLSTAPASVAPTPPSFLTTGAGWTAKRVLALECGSCLCRFSAEFRASVSDAAERSQSVSVVSTSSHVL